MANQILVEIHDYINRQLETGRKQLVDAQYSKDDERKKFIDGKMDELKTIRAFLSDHFNLTTQKYY